MQGQDDAEQATPGTLIKNAVTRTLGDSLTFPGLDLEFRIVKLEDSGSYYLLVFVEGTVVIDFDKAAARFDRVDPQLGPSILGYVYRNLDLTPAFTPEITKDLIRWHYWQGEDDDSALLEEARQELEHQFNGDEGAFNDEDIRTYAEQHYLTSRKVNEQLEPRYQENGTLTLEQCRSLCKTQQLYKALPIIEALEKLGDLRPALPELDREIYELIEGETPFSLLVTIGEQPDLVREVYGEHEQMIYQSGLDFQPTYALRFDPDEPESLETLKDTLGLCRLILEQTKALCYALEAFDEHSG